MADESGRRKAVITSYKAYLELLDLCEKIDRGAATSEDFQRVLEHLGAGFRSRRA